MSEDQLDLPLWQRLGENNISDAALFREFGDIPSLVKVVRRHNPPRSSETEKSYEEANWAHLSPAFRAAHNRLRRMRGQSPIPQPAVDLYVPKPAVIRQFDANDPEVRAAARAFVGPTLMGVRGGEGFTINGQAVNDLPSLGTRQVKVVRDPPTQQAGEGEELFPGGQFPGSRGGEGFSINGARVKGPAVPVRR